MLGMQIWQHKQDKDGNSAGALLVCVSPSRRYMRGLAKVVDNHVHGVTQVSMHAGGGSI